MSNSRPADPNLSSFTKRRRVYIACTACRYSARFQLAIVDAKWRARRKRKIRCITAEESPDKPCERCSEKGLRCEYLAVAEEQAPSSSHPPSSSSARNARFSNPGQLPLSGHQLPGGYPGGARPPTQHPNMPYNSFHPRPPYSAQMTVPPVHPFAPTQYQSQFPSQNPGQAQHHPGYQHPPAMTAPPHAPQSTHYPPQGPYMQPPAASQGYYSNYGQYYPDPNASNQPYHRNQ
ncbi:hypothetical protein C8F04DRAFT_1398280 [Mycena alexandri]|uniref:Zn(2)-C6 fungal-type domain-containing protein n=1 Tax=Mycena alexandri TaxID=1745969 RepID=A0AAD6X2H1_9AGAR|nr:hypothetical protein C8F04DRAFT_1398280 [Mycena alexandri]